MVSKVKQEDIIELSSSGSSSDSVDEAMPPVRSASTKIRSSDDEERGLPLKKPKIGPCIALPLGFLDPLSPEGTPPQPLTIAAVPPPPMTAKNCKQFWKAGDYEGPADKPSSFSIGMDHVRVHPKFLHSNATSHKWALGALAELLDNSLDEACNGATYVNIDVLQNQKDGSRMLLVEDDGGGMDPDKLRQCMSLGYSMKSKSENTIGQYGNGFKTSTMRLGADVIVFSRCRCGKEKQSPTQSIGILSYTFLRCTGKDDIVVPMIDYEKVADDWKRMKRSTLDLWNKNLETILKWSPYFTEAELLQQLSTMTDHGTRIVIYNLWEDDQGELELDFETDKHDIQIRGVNRDEKKIRMAHQFPNSRHFLTYRHSLRSYASILYLRLPPGFRMILRGKEIEHHNIVDDMMLVQEKAYRPQTVGDGIQKDQTVVAVLMLGFVKDAKDHIDIQGFNVYHKNRLIKPFWRVWNAAGSDGRGVIGVLEANFVEPAHDKQDFERTPVLTRLEARLMKIQKAYWASNCHQIGYAPRHSKKVINGSVDTESSPQAPRHNKNLINESVDKGSSPQAPRHNKNHINESVDKESFPEAPRHNKKLRHESVDKEVSPEAPIQLSFLNAMKDASQSSFASPVEKSQDSGIDSTQKSLHVESAYPSHSSPCLVHNGSERVLASNGDAGIDQSATRSNSKVTSVVDNGNRDRIEGLDVILKQLTDENRTLKCRMEKLQKSMLHELQNEREQNKFLREQLDIADRSMEELNKEQEALIDIFSEERSRRDREEENLRKKLKEASAIIQHLTEKSSSSQNHIKTENRGDVENLFQQTKN